MAAAAILRNRKMAISQQRLDQSTRNLARRRTLPLLSLPAPKMSTFYKSKMAAAAILKNRKMAISQQRFHRIRSAITLQSTWPHFDLYDHSLHQHCSYVNYNTSLIAISKHRQVHAFSYIIFIRFHKLFVRFCHIC